MFVYSGRSGDIKVYLYNTQQGYGCDIFIYLYALCVQYVHIVCDYGHMNLCVCFHTNAYTAGVYVGQLRRASPTFVHGC